MTHPCVDCGEDNILILEFDHVRGKKTFGVCVMGNRIFTIETIQKEIDKCEVRCANCHRIKIITADVRSWRNRYV